LKHSGWFLNRYSIFFAFSALTLLVGRQEGHLARKKTEWRAAGMVICLGQGADLHMAQLMSLPLTVSCFSKIQTGFPFLVPAYLGSPRKRAVKRVYIQSLINRWFLELLCLFPGRVPSIIGSRILFAVLFSSIVSKHSQEPLKPLQMFFVSSVYYSAVVGGH